MKKLLFSLLLILIVGFYVSCKKMNDTDVIISPVDTAKVVLNYQTKEIEIRVPAGSTFKPAGSKVFSFGRAPSMK